MDARARWQVPEHEVVELAARAGAHCLVIPVIDEGPRLASLLRRAAAAGVLEQVDVVIVDGGSRDGSTEPGLLARSGVRTLLTKRDRGTLSAQLRCAYAYAMDQGYEGVVTIDGNDKDDPAAVPTFVAALRDGFDLVQGSRYLPGAEAINTPWVRDLAIRWVHAPLLSLASGQAWTDTTQGFRGYSRRLLLDERVAVFRDVFAGYELLPYLLRRAPRLGFRCLELPTSRRYPAGAVPTKISSVRGSLTLLRDLIATCLGRYDP